MQTSFQGYRRGNGRVGIRNTVLVMYTVNCARHVAENICAKAQRENIPAQLIGNGTCFDDQSVINRMLRLIAHGNIGAILIVGHGCEFIQATQLERFAKEQKKPVGVVMDQTLGTTMTIERGMDEIRRLWQEIRADPRCALPISDLTVGLLNGARDRATAAVYTVAVDLLQNGASVLIGNAGGSEDEERLLLQNAETDVTRKNLHKTLEKAANFYSMNRVETPELSYTALPNIRGVLKLTQTPRHGGAWYLDTIQDEAPETGLAATCITDEAMDMICSEAQIVLYPMRFGAISGTVGAPLVTVCADEKIIRQFPDEIDCAEPTRLETLFADICNGKPTKTEILNIYEGRLLACAQGE